MQTLAADKFRFADFEVDFARRSLKRLGQPLTLNAKTFDLLQQLIENRGTILSKGELLDRVWPDQFVEENNLTVQISALRKVFGEAKGGQRFIATVPGKGYSFVAEVEADDAAAEVVIENRSISRLVVEEFSQRSAVPELPAGVRRNAFSTLTVAGVVLFVAIMVFAGYVWQSGRTAKAVPLQQFSIKRLTASGKVANAALSIDGRLFAYSTSSEGNLMVGHTAGGEPLEVRPPAEVTYRSINFSPDGAMVYYLITGKEHPTGSLFRVPALGGVAERLRDGVRARVSFSPDMSRFAFVRTDRDTARSTLFIAETLGGPPRELLSRPIDLRFEPASAVWSPDGNNIAVGAVVNPDTSCEILSVSVSDGKATQITERRLRGVNGLTWTGDGRGLLMAATEQAALDGQLFHISIPDGDMRPINPDLNHHTGPVSISATGATFLSVQAEIASNIWIAPANDFSQAKQITFSSMGSRNGRTGLDWLPDGRILYSALSGKSHNLWTVNADGSGERQLTPSGGHDHDPSVTADGRTIVFRSTRSGASEIWRVDVDGSGLRQLTSGGFNTMSSVSPDGKWVVYVSTQDTMGPAWRMPLAGGPPEKIIDRPTSWVRVSPDSRSLVCGYNDGGVTKLAIFSIDGGTPLKVFDLPATANLRFALRWTPDGRSISYRDWQSGYWVQSLDGGEPRKLDDMPEEKLFASAWSRDGKQFAFSRGQEIRDVILMQDPAVR